MKKRYCVRLWYTWHTDIDVEADSPAEAQEIADNMSDDEIFEGCDRGSLDLEYDTTEIFGGDE